MKENDKIYDAALIIVSCLESQKFIIKDLYEMEDDATRCGDDYRGLSNIVDILTQKIETHVWKIFEAMDM